jgi:hypothetical protein
MSLKAQQTFFCALGYKTYTFRCIDLEYICTENTRIILVFDSSFPFPHLLWTGTRLSL